MTRFQIWYMKPDWFAQGIMGIKPDQDRLEITHALVREMEVPADIQAPLDRIYCAMQAENWSPNGEARALIRSLGLAHTSMSVGDVIVNAFTDVAFMVAPVGFTRLGEEGDREDAKWQSWLEER